MKSITNNWKKNKEKKMHDIAFQTIYMANVIGVVYILIVAVNKNSSFNLFLEFFYINLDFSTHHD